MLQAILFTLAFGAVQLSAAPSSELAPAAPILPDFARYIDIRTLTHKDLGTRDSGRRIIFVGDIHSMLPSLQQLLHKVHYNPQLDTLVHTGDIISKGVDYNGTLEWLSSNGILGVRGNQDEKVIEWRGWIDWVTAQPDGLPWLDKMERKYPDGIEADDMKSKKKKKRFPISSGWIFNGEHYRIAMSLTDRQYQYLLDLPLTLHLVPLHTFVTHAGMLPMDPTLKPTSKRQPLSHVPELDHPKPPTRLLRMAQEVAILREVPQNINPWTLLNVRSILNDGTITRDNGVGLPWSDLWNTIMSRCSGFVSVTQEGSDIQPDAQLIMGSSSTTKPNFQLPCHPATVVYGHAASRGLDMKRWTKGLDTGCVYGRKLTALVVGGHARQLEIEGASQVEFGEQRKAQIASVSCPNPDNLSSS